MSEEATTETTEQTEASTQEAQTTETTTTQEATTEVSKTGLLEMLRSSLPEDKLSTIGSIKDDESLVKSWLYMTELRGKKSDIPAEDATPEQKAEFAAKFGVDKIKFDPETENIEFDPKYGETGKEYNDAYKPHLKEVLDSVYDKFSKNPSPSAFKEAALEFIKADAERVWQAEIEAKKASDEQLKQSAAKNGLSVPQYQAVIKEGMDRGGYTLETPVSQILHDYAKLTSGSTTIKGSTVPNSPAGITSRLSAINNDPDFMNPTPATMGRHNELVKEYQELSFKKVDNTM